MKQSAKAKNKVRNQKKDMTSMAEKPLIGVLDSLDTR